MNPNELKGEIVRCGLSVPRVAEQLGIGKKAMYAKLSGTSQFKLKEISDLKALLELSDEQVAQIFFD